MYSWWQLEVAAALVPRAPGSFPTLLVMEIIGHHLCEIALEEEVAHTLSLGFREICRHHGNSKMQGSGGSSRLCSEVCGSGHRSFF